MEHIERRMSGKEHARITVRGDVIGKGFDRLRDAIENAINCGALRLIVDVSSVGCFEPAAYQFLVNAAEQMAANGGWLKLLNGGPLTRRLIDLIVLETANRLAWAERTATSPETAGTSSTSAEGGELWVDHEELVAV